MNINKTKKQWQKPEIVILDSPQGGTNNQYVHEATAFKQGFPTSVRGTAPGQKIINQAGTGIAYFQNAVS